MKRFYKTGLTLVLAMALAVLTDCKAPEGDDDPVVVTEHPDLVPITLRETVSLADEAGTSGGYLTAADGSSDYIQDTDGTDFIHNITPFEIGQYEVTYELWYTVRVWAEANGYTFANQGREGSGGTIGAAPTTGAKLEPVTTVNWRDAIVWCNAYSEMDKRTPCYYTTSAKTTVLRASSNSMTISADNGDIPSDCVNWSANGYRLPTEGEWQYAASCAATYPYNYASGADAAYDATSGGSDIDGDLDEDYSGDVAWYSSNSGSKTQTAGTKKPNAFGLYDMSGNVCEWCWDWYGDGTLPSAETDDFKGREYSSSLPFRMSRSGAWIDNANSLQDGRPKQQQPLLRVPLLRFPCGSPPLNVLHSRSDIVSDRELGSLRLRRKLQATSPPRPAAAQRVRGRGRRECYAVPGVVGWWFYATG